MISCDWIDDCGRDAGRGLEAIGGIEADRILIETDRCRPCRPSLHDR